MTNFIDQKLQEFREKFTFEHYGAGEVIKEEIWQSSKGSKQLESFLLSSLQSMQEEAYNEGFSKGYAEGEKFANKIDDAMPALNKMQKTADEILASLSSPKPEAEKTESMKEEK